MENTATPQNAAPAPEDNCCQAKQAAREVLGKAAAFAKQKPLLSLAVAAGIGLLVGSLARRS